MIPSAVARFDPILAHQYGWDELLMFLVPIVLAVAGVRYAEKRAASRRRAQEESAHTSGEDVNPEAERPSP